MKPIRVIPLCAAGALIAGCGGGGGSIGAPGPAGNSALDQARSQLRTLAASGAAPSPTGLHSALSLFQQAAQTASGGSQAQFGEAVCLTALVAAQLDGGEYPPAPPPGLPSNPPSPPGPPPVSGGGSGSAGSGVAAGGSTSTSGTSLGPVVLPPVPPGGPGAPPPVPSPQSLGLFWNEPALLGNPYALLTELAPIGDLRFGAIPFSGYRADDATVRRALLGQLDTAAQDLQAVEADPKFTFSLPDPAHAGHTLTAGLPEVYLFDAYVQTLRAELALSLAYVRDPGANYAVLPEYTPAGVAVTLPNGLTYLDTNHDGKLEPGEYLPPPPFLTLSDNGAIPDALAALGAAADRASRGITGVLARGSATGYLIGDTQTNQAILTQIRDNVLPLLKQAATGPVTLQFPHLVAVPLVLPGAATRAVRQPAPLPHATRDVFVQPSPGNNPPTAPNAQPDVVTVNLTAWATNPPADLSSLAPTYTLGADGYPDPSLTTYPDPTFAGLFPHGLPKDLLP